MSDYADDKMIDEGKRLRRGEEAAAKRYNDDPTNETDAAYRDAICGYEEHASDNLEAYRNTIEVLWWAMRWDQMIVAGPETSVEGLASLRTDVESR